MNAPPPSSHFILTEDEKKITYKADSKIINSGTFELVKEDHTMGNLLRHALLRDERVIFAGYRVPHPLDHRVLIRVRTKDSNTKPMTTMQDAMHALADEISDLSTTFMKQLKERKDLIFHLLVRAWHPASLS
eukprot:gb/GEZN01029840.1/.p1 GENE.gb/GEZN01029840.1/~~gb/GEZN01029840.1/.p1  ORF type:complete len:132 (-),score=11.31 gb/GEZN01029840.1/:45-440(-)